MQHHRIGLAVLAFAALGSTAGAQTPSLREACMPSAKLLCAADVAAHNRDAVKACLLKNFDKVAPACQAAIKAAQADKASHLS